MKPDKNFFRQLGIFIVLGWGVFLCQFIARLLIDIILKNQTQLVHIWPFEPQALGSFLAFFLSNIVGKTVSYVSNRKITFHSNSNVAASAAGYTVMVIVFLIIETIISTPMRNTMYLNAGYTFTGAELSTITADNHTAYQFYGALVQAICGFIDGTICFFMDKFVFMRKH